jgi:hypothetical protein
MANKAFYKQSNDLWLYRNENGHESIFPAGSCRLLINGNQVSIRETNEGTTFIQGVLVTSIEKSATPDDFYTDIDEFLGATAYFFASASGGGGSSDNLTIQSPNPYIDLIDTDALGNNTRLSRSNVDNEFTITNDVLVPAESNAFQLNGSDEYINFGSIAGFERTDTFSLRLWYKTSATGGAMCIIGKRDGDAAAKGYAVRIRPNQSKFIVMVCDTDGTNELQVDFGYTGSEFHDGNWHHLIVTYDGSSNATGIKLYVDNSEITGSSVGQSSITGTIINTSNFQIGRENASTGQYFNGDVDEVAVYTKVLSTSEISDDYNSGSGRYGLSTDDGLYSGWHFDESTGITAEDYSTNDRDGVGINTDDSNWVTGHVLNGGGVIEEITLISSKNGSAIGEQGIIEIGNTELVDGGIINAKAFNSKLMRVDTNVYESAQTGVEYYSPNQNGGISGKIYRRYVPLVACAGGGSANAPYGFTVSGAVQDYKYMVDCGGGYMTTLPHIDYGSTVRNIEIQAHTDRFMIYCGSSISTGTTGYAWVDYTK